MKALVLAAGLGTRLRPLTATRAKPTLPVLGVPTLWFGAWHLKRELDPEAIAVNMSHAPDTVRAACENQRLRAFTGVSFDYSDESSGILGSSGALWKLAPWLGRGTLAVCNGDSISFPSWKKMAETHRRSGALLTIHARAFKDATEPYTNLSIGTDGKVGAFGAKALSGLMFAGNYLIEAEAITRLPAGASELRPSLLEPLAREGRLFAHREDGPWLDTGGLAEYARAQFELLDAFPAARPLVEALMREEMPGCWVPRSWTSGGGPRLEAPVVLTGSQERWLAGSRSYGPRFVGIEPPATPGAAPFANALVCSEHVQRLE